MPARYTLHRADGAIHEQWTDTPPRSVLAALSRRRDLPPGCYLTSGGRVVANHEQLLAAVHRTAS